MSGDAVLRDALLALRAAPRRRLFLDYDGTLVDLAAQPELALADADLIDLLRALARSPGTEVVVVSGRARASLGGLLGALPIGLSAEHGLWLRPPVGGASWRALADPALDLRAVVAILEHAARRHPGARVERKERSLAFHYRNADLDDDALRRLRVSLRVAAGPDATVLDGKCVIDVMPRGVGKRLAMAALQNPTNRPNDDVAVFAVGDDTTDLSLLDAAPPKAWLATVGTALPRRTLWFAAPANLRAFLRQLL